VSFDWRGVRMCPSSLSLPVWLISIPLRVIQIKLLNPNPNLPGAIASRILGEVLATATPGTWLWGFPGRATISVWGKRKSEPHFYASSRIHLLLCFSKWRRYAWMSMALVTCTRWVSSQSFSVSLGSSRSVSWA
jgi:hypothetical protein